MPSPVIDRDAWAALLGELVQQETDGNRTQFAALVGVDRKTVTRWLASDVAVSEESVRAVARALGIPVGALLVRVGYYSSDDLPAEPAPHPREIAEDDEAMRLIQESDAPPSLKRELVAHLLSQRAEHERQRLEEARRMLELARRSRRRAG